MIKQYYIWTLGCQMNKSDSERIDAVLESSGFKKTSVEAEADLIVVVACSVRQSAVDRIYGKSHQWQKKREAGELLTVLTGCVADDDKNGLRDNFDLVLPIDEIGRLPKLISSHGVKEKVGKGSENDYFHINPKYQNNFQAYVPIMTGCNNYCSYCIVPYVRGREKSRLADEIIIECQTLIKKGCKEIILLGQNVNSYRAKNIKIQRTQRQNKETINFSKLLSEIDKIKGDYWLRFITSHPKDLSDDLIAVMRNGQHITPYLHLAVQSGDDDILQAMNRGYMVDDYLRLLKKVRTAMPDIMISTDVIVGFPGETKRQFQNTVKLFRQVGFDMAYIAQYSPRFQTAAAKLDDSVSQVEKKRREMELTKVLKKTALNHNQKLVNRTVKVLVDRYKKGNCFGKIATFKMVKFGGSRDMVGQFVKVNIVKVNSWGLMGKLI